MSGPGSPLTSQADTDAPLVMFWMDGRGYNSLPQQTQGVLSPFAVQYEERVIPIIPTNSSVIRGLGYRWPRTIHDNMKPIITVVMNSGAVYEYEDIGLDVLLGALNFDDPDFSLGQYYNSNIRGKYESRRIDRHV